MNPPKHLFLPKSKVSDISKFSSTVSVNSKELLPTDIRYNLHRVRKLSAPKPRKIVQNASMNFPDGIIHSIVTRLIIWYINNYSKESTATRKNPTN